MFFILSKLFYFFLNPLLWILFLLIWSYKSSNESKRKKRLFWAIGLFFFFSNSFVFKEVSRVWEVHGIRTSNLKPCKVALVLGGMTEYNNDLKLLSIRRSGDRIWQAITLYKTHKVDFIMISGANGYVSDNPLQEAKQMKELLITWGIPGQKIITETRSRNTSENLIESKKVLLKKFRTLPSILLVTSSRHMRRAAACARHEKINFAPYPTDLFTGPKRYYQWFDYFLPDFSNFDDWHAMLKEWFGFVIYKCTGKI